MILAFLSKKEMLTVMRSKGEFAPELHNGFNVAEFLDFFCRSAKITPIYANTAITTNWPKE